MATHPDWYQFQEDICSYFISIGASAETNVKVQGVRTTHDIDVLVKTKYLGENLTWIVEAKKWKSKVSKLQVLGLRTIAEDIGVDKAFIISEVGFQSGAYESIKNTNVNLKTFEELKINTKELIESEIIKSYKKRLNLLETRYWAHSKSTRKEYSLRDEMYQFPPIFSGQILLLTAHKAILSAENKNYPIDLETNLEEKTGELIAENFQQLTNWLNLNLNFFDEKLLTAEVKMIENNDFNPKYILERLDDISTMEDIASLVYNKANKTEDRNKAIDGDNTSF